MPKAMKYWDGHELTPTVENQLARKLDKIVDLRELELKAATATGSELKDLQYRSVYVRLGIIALTKSLTKLEKKREMEKIPYSVYTPKDTTTSGYKSSGSSTTHALIKRGFFYESSQSD